MKKYFLITSLALFASCTHQKKVQNTEFIGPIGPIYIPDTFKVADSLSFPVGAFPADTSLFLPRNPEAWVEFEYWPGKTVGMDTANFQPLSTGDGAMMMCYMLKLKVDSLQHRVDSLEKLPPKTVIKYISIKKKK